MSINWTVRLKNKAFWLALIPSLLLLVQQLAAVCGFTLDLTALQATVDAADAGAYQAIHLNNLQLTGAAAGNYTIPSSCVVAGNVTIAQAAANVHKRLRQVEFRTQAPDHPILWGAGDSYYLKFYIFQVCEEK